MTDNNPEQHHTAYARGGNEKTELRGLAPADLVKALDAIALAKGLDRNAHVVNVLEAHVKSYLDEMTLVSSMMRGNPLLPEASRSHA
jgi:hypothetical protein